jgi:hypothetical protein
MLFAMIRREFPLLDYIKECKIVGTPRSPVKWHEVKPIGPGAVQESTTSAASSAVYAVGVLLLVAAVLVVAVRRSRKPDDRFER